MTAAKRKPDDAEAIAKALTSNIVRTSWKIAGVLMAAVVTLLIFISKLAYSDINGNTSKIGGVTSKIHEHDVKIGVMEEILPRIETAQQEVHVDVRALYEKLDRVIEAHHRDGG